MILIHCCPKCLGDLTAEADEYGEYAICLYCGFVLEKGANRNFPLRLRRERWGKAPEVPHEPPARLAL